MPFAANPISSSSGMLLQRKNDSRDASSRSLRRYVEPGGDVFRRPFNPEEKAWGGQNPLEAASDSTLEILLGASGLVEIHHDPDVVLCEWPPIGSGGKRRENLSCAWLLGRAILGKADKYFSTARRLARSSLAIRAADHDKLDRRVPVIVLVGHLEKTGRRRLYEPFGLPEPTHKRDADVMNPGLYGHAHFQAGVGFVHVLLELRIALRIAHKRQGHRHALGFAANGESLKPHAVEPNVELVRLAHAHDVGVQLAPQ